MHYFVYQLRKVDMNTRQKIFRLPTTSIQPYICIDSGKGINYHVLSGDRSTLLYLKIVIIGNITERQGDIGCVLSTFL